MNTILVADIAAELADGTGGPEHVEQARRIAAVVERGMATRLRDWLHEQPHLTRCDAGSDTCGTWEQAYGLRDVALGVNLGPYVSEEQPTPEDLRKNNIVRQQAADVRSVYAMMALIILFSFAGAFLGGFLR